MIRLIRTDGQEILLNADWIKSIEGNSHTTIILTTGEKITVKNEIVDVITKLRAALSGKEQERREYEEAQYSGSEVRKK
jgi:uncharacterized protein YlzI (FlbEa/FlbD family)